jgi:hypothetical protein
MSAQVETGQMIGIPAIAIAAQLAADGNDPFVVKGCPVADGGVECTRGCGGGWPGSNIKTPEMTEAVRSGTIIPDKLGCGPLTQRAEDGYNRLAEAGTVFQAKQ